MTRVSMSDLAYDIEQLYIEGYSPKGIAAVLNCPIDLVYAWIETEHLSSDKTPACYTMQDTYDPFNTVNS